MKATHSRSSFTLQLVLAAALAAPAFAQNDPCVVQDNGSGTVTLPPEGCAYLSPDEFHMIVDGLPPGTEIIITGIHRDFICKQKGVPQENCNFPGGNLGGEIEFFQSVLEFEMQGTGDLAGFQRSITIPTNCEVHTGPRNPGDPVQSFRNEMVQLQGAIFGDPDFDQLQVVAGSFQGLPSPGQTTLTRLGPPGSDFQVDSFFDITYRIDFVGAPGSVLEGLSGSTEAPVHVASFGPPSGGDCTPDAAGGGCFGTCPDATQICVARCARFDPASGFAFVTECDCAGQGDCQVFLPGGAAGVPGGNPCVLPDDAGGTVTLPPQGCAYLSPDEVHLIIDGLPAGTTIELAPIHLDFICKQGGIPGCPPPGQCETPGGNLGGNIDCFVSTLQLDLQGTGDLAGFNRNISVFLTCQVHTAPRNPGDPVQEFDTDFVFMQGQIFGDPDFDQLVFTAGTGNGLPSPGHTTLTRLGPPGSDFNVDSFFDITYRIDFAGAPGSILEGFAGQTTGTIRMSTGGGPKCVGDCPPGTECVETTTVLPDGQLEVCCTCVPIQGDPGACCFDADGDGLPESCQVVSLNECKAIGGTFEGPNTVCQGTGACCFGIIGGACVEVDGICCDNFMGSFLGVGSVCLGDSNMDGSDDACIPPPTECEPNPDLTGCTSVTCPVAGQECVPICVNFDPATGLTRVLVCDCRGQDECHVGIPGPPQNCGTPSEQSGAGGCVQPNAGGTVMMPPAGCGYVSPDDAHRIIDGLPAGTEIIIGPEHTKFQLMGSGPGGTLGGDFEVFDSIVILELCGTGDLSGFNRTLFVPVSCETHTGPRTPGAPVQQFPNKMWSLQGQIFGDPDFDTLQVVGGEAFGLPSPGQTTLTQLPSGNFNVDSFFDITYRIEFSGAPGSVLEGLSGTTEATVRMATGNTPGCVGGCPPGQVCVETTTVRADGTLDICCECLPEDEVGACCLDLDGDGLPETCQVLHIDACTAQGGIFLGGFTTCLGDLDGDGADDACVPPADCGPTPDGQGCLAAVCDDPTAQECVPVCARVDPGTGEVTVIACECRGLQECHLSIPGGAAVGCPSSTTQGPNGCVVPDVGGTVMLPPQGCSYLSPDDVHKIVDGLPAGTTILLGPEHTKFQITNSGPGGSLGGEFEQFDSILIIDVCGTGDLAGFNRTLVIPIQCETHIGPRTPGDQIQDFPSTMFSLQGAIFGDPDFDQITVVGGDANGLPSPGNTTLMRLPSGDFTVDSFFDITYRIDFVGAPGSVLDGLSGSTTATVRMSTGGYPRCEGPCPPGTECVTTRTIDADGTVVLCCDCVPVCIGDTNGDGVVNVTDLVNAILNWGPCPAPCPPCVGDIDGNCVVNVTDLVSIILNWGPCP